MPWPSRRPAGYRWFKVERIGAVTFRYGYHVGQKQLRATIVGAPMSSRINLVARPTNRDAFMAVARALITARCDFKRRVRRS